MASRASRFLGYSFGYGGDADHRYLWYDYRPHRSREGPRKVLGDFRGVLPTDGFSGYESLVSESQGRLTAAECWTHTVRVYMPMVLVYMPMVLVYMPTVQVYMAMVATFARCSGDLPKRCQDRRARRPPTALGPPGTKVTENEMENALKIAVTVGSAVVFDADDRSSHWVDQVQGLADYDPRVRALVEQLVFQVSPD